jgi:hypothetical protein
VWRRTRTAWRVSWACAMQPSSHAATRRADTHTPRKSLCLAGLCRHSHATLQPALAGLSCNHHLRRLQPGQGGGGGAAGAQLARIHGPCVRYVRVAWHQTSDVLGVVWCATCLVLLVLSLGACAHALRTTTTWPRRALLARACRHARAAAARGRELELGRVLRAQADEGVPRCGRPAGRVGQGTQGAMPCVCVCVCVCMCVCVCVCMCVCVCVRARARASKLCIHNTDMRRTLASA